MVKTVDPTVPMRMLAESPKAKTCAIFTTMEGETAQSGRRQRTQPRLGICCGGTTSIG
jgi:hypothetical protein